MLSSAICFLFSILVLPLNFPFISLPSVNISQSVMMVGTITVTNVILTDISIKPISINYDPYGFNLTFLENTSLHAYLLFGLGATNSGNLSMYINIPAGQNVVYKTDADTTDCTISNATLISNTLSIEITNITQVTGDIPFFYLGIIEKMLPMTINNMLKEKIGTILPMLTNYTEVPEEILPAYYSEMANFNNLSSVVSLVNLSKDLPPIYDMKLSAEVYTPNSLLINAAVDEKGFNLTTSYVDVQISPNTSFSLIPSFYNVTCDKENFNCILLNGIELFNVKTTSIPKGIPLMDHMLLPLVIGLLNPMINKKSAGFLMENEYLTYTFELFNSILSII